MKKVRYTELKEYIVLRNGALWSDRLDSEEECIEHIRQCVDDGEGLFEDYEYREMIESDYDIYR